MTLCKRIVPTLLVKGRALYKGVAFKATERGIGSAVAAATVHAKRGVDEICILDIAATVERRGPDLEMVKALSAECFIPITVGGGVRSLQDIDDLLRAGADKVSINTAFFQVPGLISKAALRFGRQAIVVSIDLLAYVPGVAAREAMRAEEEGAGELLITSVPRDGTLEGYDLDLIREVSAAVDIPVVASGGAGTYEHLLQGIQAGADAVAAGAMFQYTDATPRGAARYLKEHGQCVRL